MRILFDENKMEHSDSPWCPDYQYFWNGTEAPEENLDPDNAFELLPDNSTRRETFS